MKAGETLSLSFVAHAEIVVVDVVVVPLLLVDWGCTRR